jgi:hypothetical protein
MVSLLRPAGASGLILLHQHCDVDLHVHVPDLSDLDSWRTEHVRHDSCEDSDGAPGSAQIDTADCCAHDVPIIYLVAFDLTAPSRTGAAKNLSLSPVPSVAAAPAPTRPPGIDLRARSLGRVRPDLGARSAVAALLLRNHALLL